MQIQDLSSLLVYVSETPPVLPPYIPHMYVDSYQMIFLLDK